MNTHPSVQDLEALLRGTLDEDRSIVVSAHTDDCALCSRELAWLKAEHDLFAQRARGVPPSEVWAQIESQIAARITQKESTPRGIRRILRDAFHSQQAQWFAVGAAAVAIFGVVAASPLSPLHRGQWSAPYTVKKSQPLPAASDLKTDDDNDDNDADDADDKDDTTEDSVSATTKLSGPISVEISTSSAEVEVLAGPAGEAKLTVTDSPVKAVRLVPPSAGQSSWRLEFDGNSTLHVGHLQLLAPVGTSVQIKSASGDIQLANLKADAVIATASGSVHVKDARAVQIESVSGDVDLLDTVGKIDVKTTSGELHVSGEITQPLHYTSVSGDLMMAGSCRVASCKVSAETTSGSVTIHGHKDNSFVAKLSAASGELTGTEGLTVEMKRSPGQRTEWSTKVGTGLGLIELRSMSGDLQIEPR